MWVGSVGRGERLSLLNIVVFSKSFISVRRGTKGRHHIIINGLCIYGWRGDGSRLRCAIYFIGSLNILWKPFQYVTQISLGNLMMMVTKVFTKRTSWKPRAHWICLIISNCFVKLILRLLPVKCDRILLVAVFNKWKTLINVFPINK